MAATIPQQVALDRLARLARRSLNVPTALITVIERDRQRFIGADGLPESLPSERATPLEMSLCKYVEAGREPLLIGDFSLAQQPEAARLARAFGYRAYAGVPMWRVGAGAGLFGTFCVLDHVARDWSADELLLLTDLAATAATELTLTEALSGLRQARAYADATVDTVREPLLVLVDGLVVASANRAFYRTFQIVAGETIGRRVDAIDDGQWDIPELTAALERVFSSGEAFDDFQVTHEFAALGVRTLVLNARVLEADDGADRRVLLAMEDITDQAQSQRERQMFMDSLAHDLRNPVAAIRGEAQLLERRIARDTLVPERLSRGLDVIGKSTVQMMQIIDEMVDTVYLAAGHAIDLRLSRVAICELVMEMVGVANTVPPGGRVVVDRCESITVQADEARLRRVIDNVLSNALKYSAVGERVRVLVAAEDRDGAPGVVVRVADRGIGIPAADLPRIFEQFHRGANVAAISGSGIGLAGARQLVELHGGTIAIDSVEGAGTTVTVWLPLVPGVASRDAATEPAGIGVSAGRDRFVAT